MKFHLIRSEEISTDRFGMIAGIVHKFSGPVEFIVKDEDIEENSKGTPGTDEEGESLLSGKAAASVMRPWEDLFMRCETERQANPNITDDDYVVFFTDYGNEMNWFSSWDRSGRKNFFIQTSGWEEFVESEECFPVVYELATIPLYLSVCNTLDEVEEIAHRDTPRGCPFDFCEDKTQVRLKLRTGDVCPECRERMMARNINPEIARQVFAILDSIRTQMLFRNRFALTQQLSRLEVSEFYKEIRFTDIGRAPVKLEPREMAVYLFFLNHPEGVGFPYMVDHRAEIKSLYRNLSDDANMVRFENTIDAIVTNDAGTLSQIIARIKGKITTIVGPDIAKHYIIFRDQGLGRHIITLDRTLVWYPDAAAYHAGRNN